jgi:Ca2+-binding RTX toxin-like protein
MPIISTLYGTEIADTIYGTADGENIVGLGGNDFLSGQGGDDALVGGDGNDILVGDYGNDTLWGDAGDDAMFGGYGNDYYRVDSIGDSVIEIAGAGRDTVGSRVDFTLGAHIENLELFGSASTGGAIRGTGNSLANEIWGNSLNNVLNGLGGNDILRGGAGNDRLNGGAGNDQLFGDSGIDILHGGGGSDFLNGGIGSDRYLFTQADANLSAVDRVRFDLGADDRIDLRQIDAVAGDGNQAFTFIGNNAFSGCAGELRYELVGTWMDWTDPFQAAGERFEVSGDTDGDGIADFKILVEVQSWGGGTQVPSPGIQAADFWL